MLQSLYDQLLADASGHQYRAVAIGTSADTFLGVDSLGRPVLFTRSSGPSPEAPLRTTQVSLRLGAPFTLTPKSSAPVRGLFDCLACESTDRAAIETFLVLSQAFTSRVQTQDAPAATMAEFFRSIVRLFSVPPARDLAAERQGLWGELFMMRSVNGFAFWAPFWHTEPTRRFDFSFDGKRIEVKTALEGPRIHHFAHRQIYPTPGEQIIVASLLVSHDDAGLSLRDLIEECRHGTGSTPQFMSLERAVRRAGMDDPDEAGPLFDSAAAATNLAWFQSEHVPHFQVPEPPGVSDTRYRVDLSTAPRMGHDQLNSWLDQWQPTHALTP